MTRLTPQDLRDSWRSWLLTDGLRSGPYWLQLLWTLLFCLVVALGFTVLGFLSFGNGKAPWRTASAWWQWYQINLVVTLVIGTLIHGLFELGAWLLGSARLRRLRGPARGIYFAGIPIVGVLLGWPFGAWLVSDRSGIRLSGPSATLMIGSLLVSVFISFLFYQWFEGKARQIQAERRATEARLHLLQAQIEPHFLFNTLANVLSLIDHDAPRAKRMLESFTDYLRASLGELRSEHSNVGAELDMAEAYLQLIQMRMDDRLRYRIEADEVARRVVMPPLLLQPLIENAIQHGLEPKVDGGVVVVRAIVADRQLRLLVEDDGLGLAERAPASGPAAALHGSLRPEHHNGLALHNVRQRLRARYGDAADLQLDRLAPGTRATITLPID